MDDMHNRYASLYQVYLRELCLQAELATVPPPNSLGFTRAGVYKVVM